jgi:ATP-dependent exoDNAse (exonuclease V) alpha subunit
VVGRAGAGKTTAARAIADAYRDQGYEVHGAALAGKAAESLQAEAGIPSRTLASLERDRLQGRGALHGRSVLVLDEAGMVDARQLARVLEHAQAGGAKVVLLGDPAQLKAIGAGDAYRGLLEVHPSARLETIRRQVEPWQQKTSEHLARGRVRVDAPELV